MTARYLSADRLGGRVYLEADPSGVITRWGVKGGGIGNAPWWDHALSVECGWPLRTLSGARWVIGDGQEEQINFGAILTIKPLSSIPPVAKTEILTSAIGMEVPGPNGTEYRILPFGVLPLGFALNTVFYALIASIVAALFVVVRRVVRRHRDLCPACAYPVGESSTCTECGMVIGARSARLSARG
ncbi:MAG: hypothetical protein L0Y44_07615 [Phycisphaerales bacterium]|nr:hypothetical protein [Phycisphaerales bacterium]MCI0630503.1 hypothetical protein [Phycisphaerales bacterium]